MKVWKDILYSGTFTTPDGRQHTFTPADVRKSFVNGKRMIKAGLSVPGVWEHDIRAEPVPTAALLSNFKGYDQFREWGAGWAKGVFGRIEDFKLGRDRDGNPVTFGLFDVADDADARQLLKTRFVSSRVDRDYVDGFGRTWNGLSIGHVAATPKPVQLNQQPFGSTAMLSALPRGHSRLTVFLSWEGRTVADSTDDKKTDDSGKTTDANAGSWLKRSLDALAQLGMPMPDSVVDGDTLALALETAASVKGGDLDDDFDDDNYPDGQGTDSPGTPIMMSDLTPVQQQYQRGQEQAARQRLERRVEKTAAVLLKNGTFDVKAANGLRKRASTVQLSMVSDPGGGNIRFVSPMDEEVNSLSRVAAGFRGRPGKRGRQQILLSQTAPADVPNVGNDGRPANQAEYEKQIAEAAKAAADRVDRNRK